MIPNHPETEQILLENVLFALGNPLRLSIIRRLADGGELSCKRAAPGRCGEIHHDPPLARIAGQRRHLAASAGTRKHDSLRRDDLDTRFPGLMEILLQAK